VAPKVWLPPDALALLGELNDAAVEYVLIGEMALAVHGQDWLSETVSIVPARYARNLDRLSRVLRELEAGWRVEGETQVLEVDLSPAELARIDRWRLLTDLCELDIEFAPGGSGYHELFRDARRTELPGGLVVQVAAPAAAGAH
jgi:hypothetical protein